MIQNYDSNSVYEIYEIQDTGKKYKIGEIEDQVFYDLNKKGKRLEQGYQFRNDTAFWNQFKNISIKKISRPLGGFEPVVWGVYWTLSILVTIFFVVADSDIEDQMFWIVTSGIHLAITIKFRYSPIVVYWMAAISIIILIYLWSSGGKKKF
ncbi:hypothetical protein OAH75_01020 [Nitrosopumilus sp.]|nr:hypothetical protein [Nitrosopumilus sp.]MDB4839885.1 hypothetical protein [Nitrosopumilus sp.]